MTGKSKSEKTTNASAVELTEDALDQTSGGSKIAGVKATAPGGIKTGIWNPDDKAPAGGDD